MIHLTEILRVRISSKLYKKLEQLAKEDRRTVPDYVRLKLEEATEAK